MNVAIKLLYNYFPYWSLYIYDIYIYICRLIQQTFYDKSFSHKKKEYKNLIIKIFN